MPARKMHVDEVETDEELVRRLLAAQFPHWADLPIRAVESAGTDNAIYRLGDAMAARLPRIHWAVHQVDKERRWLPRLAPLLPLALPVQLARGEPGAGYPWPWGIYRWIGGESAAAQRIADMDQAAADLAAFIAALQRIDTEGGPLATEHGLRGRPLAPRDAPIRESLAALRGEADDNLLAEVWEAALRAPDWDRAPVWFHGDLLPGNLLVERGRLAAVIDFSGLGVGDPACDLMVAWALFAGKSRALFRTALAVDDATWARGRGHALAQALIFIPYYRETNPLGVASAWRTVHAIVDDYRANG